MNVADRLLEVTHNPRTRALLQAGRAERTPAGFSARLVAGVSAAAATGALSASASAATVTTAATSQVSSLATAVVSSVAKWIAVGVLAGGALAGGAELAFAPAPRSAERARPATPIPRAPVTQAMPAAELALPPADFAPPAPPVAPPARSEPAGSQPQEERRPASLGNEVATIDRARQALSRSDAAAALRALDQYESVPTTGTLDREARVLRIQALRVAGKASVADELTRQYLQEFPHDAHAARLRKPTSE